MTVSFIILMTVLKWWFWGFFMLGVLSIIQFCMTAIMSSEDDSEEERAEAFTMGKRIVKVFFLCFAMCFVSDGLYNSCLFYFDEKAAPYHVLGDRYIKSKGVATLVEKLETTDISALLKTLAGVEKEKKDG